MDQPIERNTTKAMKEANRANGENSTSRSDQDAAPQFPVMKTNRSEKRPAS